MTHAVDLGGRRAEAVLRPLGFAVRVLVGPARDARSDSAGEPRLTIAAGGLGWEVPAWSLNHNTDTPTKQGLDE